MTNYRRWTKEEDTLLLNNVSKFKTKGYRITAEQLDRTPGSCMSRYQRKLKDINNAKLIKEVYDSYTPVLDFCDSKEKPKVSLWQSFKDWIKWVFKF